MWNKMIGMVMGLMFGVMVVVSAAPAPDFTLTTLTGEEISLSAEKGKVVFIDFWASWCPPCRAAIPAVAELRETYDKDEVAVFGINVEQNVDKVRRFVKKKGAHYPVALADQKTIYAYQVQGIPAFYIVDQKGEIVQNYSGYSRGALDEWKGVIDGLLKNNKKHSKKSAK